MKDVISDTSDVGLHYDVPRGSVLGPLLFLIYQLTSLHELPGGKTQKLFADDNNLFISGIDKTAINSKCNNCL